MRFWLLPVAALAALPASAAETKTRVVAVEADEMHFTPPAITVQAGEAIRFQVTNRGQALHEFTIGTPQENAAHRQMMTAMGDSPDHGHMMHGDHHGMPGHGHDHSQKVVIIEPGRTAVLTARFDKPGLLEFACNIPGHYEAGMAGALTVEPKTVKEKKK